MSAVAEAVRMEQPAARAGRWSWTMLVRSGSLAVCAIALMAAAVLGSPQAIITAAIGFALSLAVVWLCFRGADRQFLLSLFLAAFAVRLAAAVASHFVLVYAGRNGYLLLDDWAYDKLGWTLARVWMGILPGIHVNDEYLMVNYTYLVAGVYYFLGHNLLAAKMMNVAFGTLTAVVVYAIGAEIFNQRAARIAALLTAFFPSLIAWSAINLKDILAVLLTTAAIFGLVRYARRHQWWALVLCLAAFLAIENLRQFVFFILAWLMPVAFLFTDRSERDPGARRAMLAVMLGLAVAGPLFYYIQYTEGMRQYLILLPFVFFTPALLLFANRPDRRHKLLLLVPLLLGIVLLGLVTNNEKLGTNFLTPKALTEAEWKRWLEENKAETGLNEFGGIKPTKDKDIIRDGLVYLPKGMFYVLLGPLPWEARSASARAVIPEMLLWYGLLAAAVVGIGVCYKSRWRDLVLPLGFAAAWIVGLALTEGNTGNIFRHRSQFIPLVLLLSAVGLLWLWTRWRARSMPPRRLA